MTQVAPFALGDLLDQHDLGLQQLTGPPEARTRRVSGVHSIEIEHPARWLAPDWVMLTTGVRLRDRPDEQRALVRELARRGVTALGFARQVVFEEVPDALLDEADAIGFPVFAVPLETPFRDIIAFVHRSLLSSDMRALQRLSSMQRYLMDALQARDPRTAVVERLSTLLDASVAILRPPDRVERFVGELPDDIAQVMVDGRAGAREVELASGWWAVAAPVKVGGPAQERWIVATHRNRRFINRLTRPAVQATAPLLAAISRLEDALIQQDRALRAALLEELVRPAGRDPVELERRAEALGVRLDRPHQVIALSSAAPDDPTGETLETRLQELLESRGVAHLLGRDGACIVGLVPPLEGELETALRMLVAAAPQAACGVGRVVTAIGDIESSHADAHVALQLAAEGTGWQRYEELDLPTLVVGHVPIERVSPAVDEVLAVLNARPSIREALDAWFDHDLDVTAAAAALHLHPNSLRYRLARLGDALGRPLRAPATIATLYLALELERREGAGRDPARTGARDMPAQATAAGVRPPV